MNQNHKKMQQYYYAIFHVNSLTKYQQFLIF